MPLVDESNFIFYEQNVAEYAQVLLQQLEQADSTFHQLPLSKQLQTPSVLHPCPSQHSAYEEQDLPAIFASQTQFILSSKC